MVFLSPWFLLGMLGVAVPILIHLLNRFRPKVIDWGAMELLRRALALRSRQIRLEDLILLALRCLALLLLALALARPTLTPSGAHWFAGETYAGVVIAIDGSFSMEHHAEVSSRFDKAKDRVGDVLKTLSAGNPVSMVMMGSRPRTVLNNVGYEADRFDKTLRELSPLKERLNLELGLQRVKSLMDEMKAPVRECYIVTDGQATTWETLSDAARKTLREIGNMGKVYFVSAAPPAADNRTGENLAITRLEMCSGAPRAGSPAAYAADVQNFGLAPVSDVVVELALEGDTICRVKAATTDSPIPPGGRASVVLPINLPAKAGFYRLTAQIDQDSLPVDNARYAVAKVIDQLRVLCVDGSGGDLPEQRETYRLGLALKPTDKAAYNSVNLSVVSPLEMPTQELNRSYDVVVLANVRDISEEQARALGDFVYAGGGLVYFPGENIADPSLVNLRLRRGEDPLLPGEMIEPVGDRPDALGLEPAHRQEGWVLDPEMPDHPLTAGIRKLTAQKLSSARVYRYFRTRELPGGSTILRLAAKLGAADDAPSRPAAGDSLVLERLYGRGKVLMFTTTVSRDWTSLMISPAGVILLNQAMTYMLRQPQDASFVVGEPLRVSLPASSGKTDLIFRDPHDNERAAHGREENGQLVADLSSREDRPETELPGFYQVSFNGEAATQALVAVNVDPSESDVRILPLPRMATVMTGVPIRLIGGDEDLAVAVRDGRVGKELWRILLTLVLAVMAVEAFLARRFARRISAEIADSSEMVKQHLKKSSEAA